MDGRMAGRAAREGSVNISTLFLGLGFTALMLGAVATLALHGGAQGKSEMVAPKQKILEMTKAIPPRPDAHFEVGLS